MVPGDIFFYIRNYFIEIYVINSVLYIVKRAIKLKYVISMLYRKVEQGRTISSQFIILHSYICHIQIGEKSGKKK